MTTDPLSRSGLRPDQVPADFVVDQGFDRDSGADHGTWGRLYRRQHDLLQGRVCEPFFAGLTALGIAADAIPDGRASAAETTVFGRNGTIGRAGPHARRM